MKESNSLQTSFSTLLNLSSVREIESQLNQFTKKAYSKTVYQHRLAAYVRLSPSVNDPRDEGSLKNHPLHIFNYVEQKNKELKHWGCIVEWYVDSEVSAATLERPAFQRMLNDLDSGKIDSLIVYDLLRASRDVGDFSMVIKFLQERRIRFFSTCDPIDLDNPFGRYMAQLRIANGQLEREMNIYRLKNGARGRAHRGLAHNSPVLGYDPVPYKKHHVQINETEAEEVKHHFSSILRPEIKNLRQWILYANEKGFTTKRYRNKNGDWKGGKRWTLTTAAYFFKNKMYIAVREYNKKNIDSDSSRLPENDRYFCTEGNWEPIVDKETFEAVQKKLNSNKQTRRQYKRHFPLSKLIVCSECGSHLVGVGGTSRDGSRHFYYGHERKMRSTGDKHNQRCSTERIRALEIEEEVVSQLRILAKDQSLIKEIAKRRQKHSKSSGKELQTVLRKKEQLRRKLEISQNNALDAVGEAESDTVRKLLLKKVEKEAKELKAVEVEIQNLKNEVKTQKQKALDLSDVFEMLKVFRKNFDELPQNEKTQILQKTIKRILLEPDRITLEIFGDRHEMNSGQKKASNPWVAGGRCSHVVQNGRGDRIRTCDPLVPNQMRYQAAPLPDDLDIIAVEGGNVAENPALRQAHNN